MVIPQREERQKENEGHYSEKKGRTEDYALDLDLDACKDRDGIKAEF